MWFSRPLRQNPRAAIPLCLAGLGSLCWEWAALWNDSTNHLSDSIWMMLVFAGLAAMPLGLIGAIVYRHFRAAGFALILAVFSPPLWLWMFFTWHPVFPAVRWLYWLYFQIPLVLIPLWRSPWPRLVKARGTGLAAAGMLCLFLVHTLIAHLEVLKAPHVSDQYLCSLCAKNDLSALQRLNNKRIVVTGVVFGQDQGLMGSPPEMGGSGNWIEFDELVGSVADGQKASILGMCKGKDVYGMIHLTDCRVISVKSIRDELRSQLAAAHSSKRRSAHAAYGGSESRQVWLAGSRTGRSGRLVADLDVCPMDELHRQLPY